MLKNISIIIVNWNSNELVKKQLNSLDGVVNQVIVVNNSPKKSLKNIVSKHKNTFLIDNDYNRGFASGCNQGLLKVSNNWVLFLNPDVEINNENLSKFLEYAQDNKKDAVSPKSASKDYSKPIPTLLSLLSEFTVLNRIVPLDIFKSKTLTGGILLVKTNVIKNLGGWDERFFLWFEDSDLTKRLTDSSFKIGFSDVRIKHLGGQSLKKIDNQLQKDIFFNAMDIYSRKYFPKLAQMKIYFLKNRFTKTKITPTINDEITSVVVPNLRKELLDNFLETNKKFLENKTELIIVTSALNEELIWKYRKEYPNVKFILIKDNKGFAHTVNIGFRASTGKFVGTCNDDVILSKNWVASLLDSTNLKTGSINPIILNTDGSMESAGISIDSKGKAYPNQNIPDSEVVDATNGACVLYKRDVLNEVGIFDERFGSYLEDIDLSLRISKAHYENQISSKTKTVHFKHQTSNSIALNKSYHDFKNWILVILKNWSIDILIKNLPQILIERGRNISGMIKGLFK